MATHGTAWPSADTLVDHRRWRPDWTTGRSCLYWYLTFETDHLVGELDPGALAAVARVPWLDPVPPEWMHLTLCDVGFGDELDDRVPHVAVAGVAEAIGDHPPLEIRLGPVEALPGAVVLRAEPLARLRDLQDRVRQHTRRALGPDRELVHRHTFWPHVSLGYTNRPVDEHELDEVLAGLGPVSARVTVRSVVLASVVRGRSGYEWTVRAEVPLGPAGSAGGGRG